MVRLVKLVMDYVRTCASDVKLEKFKIWNANDSVFVRLVLKFKDDRISVICLRFRADGMSLVDDVDPRTFTEKLIRERKVKDEQ